MPAWSSFEPPKPLVVRIDGTRLVGLALFGRYRSPTMSHGVAPSGPVFTLKCSVVTVYVAVSACAVGENPTAPAIPAERASAAMGAIRRVRMRRMVAQRPLERPGYGGGIAGLPMWLN